MNIAAGEMMDEEERISREDLIFIIDLYKAWEDLSVFDAEREEEKRKKAIKETSASLEKLSVRHLRHALLIPLPARTAALMTDRRGGVQAKVALMLRNQQQMNIKVDMIMRCLVVADRARG